MNTIGAIALLVKEYDEAIHYYTDALNFTLCEDIPQGHKRWVTLAPSGSQGTRLLLARAATPQQAEQIGHQSGGRVFLFLHSDDFWRDYRHMQAKGVSFLEEPREEPYGTVVVFQDLYGNKWDLLELKQEE